MKKKIWAAALICIVVLGMLDGCGPKEKDTEKEAAGNTETEAVEGSHATETETEAQAQGNLKEDTWYVLSGMYQHKMETEENTAVIKNVNVYNMAGTMDGETFVQASDFTNHLNQAEYEISWNRTEADEEGNTVYTVTLSAKIPWNGIQTDAEAYIEYEDISLVDATTGMVLPQHVAATDSSMARMAEVACAGTTYQVAATEDTETTFGDWTVEDGSEYPMVTYYEIKETYKVTAPAEYKGLLFVLQTQRTAEEYENGIVKGLGTDEAHTFDGTINDGSVAIELDRDYEYINAE